MLSAVQTSLAVVPTEYPGDLCCTLYTLNDFLGESVTLCNETGREKNFLKNKMGVVEEQLGSAVCGKNANISISSVNLTKGRERMAANSYNSKTAHTVVKTVTLDYVN